MHVTSKLLYTYARQGSWPRPRICGRTWLQRVPCQVCKTKTREAAARAGRHATASASLYWTGNATAGRPIDSWSLSGDGLSRFHQRLSPPRRCSAYRWVPSSMADDRHSVRVSGETELAAITRLVVSFPVHADSWLVTKGIHCQKNKGD
jgi:hypothetical protein